MDNPSVVARKYALQRAWADASVVMSPTMRRCVDMTTLHEYTQALDWILLLENRKVSYQAKAGKVQFPSLGMQLASDVARRLEWLLTTSMAEWHYQPQTKPRAVMQTVQVFRQSFVHHLRCSYPEHTDDFAARTRIATAQQVLCQGMSSSTRADVLHAAWQDKLLAGKSVGESSMVAYKIALAQCTGTWAD